jgi:hypothetical protein
MKSLPIVEFRKILWNKNKKPIYFIYELLNNGKVLIIKD